MVISMEYLWDIYGISPVGYDSMIWAFVRRCVSMISAAADGNSRQFPGDFGPGLPPRFA